MNELRCLRAIDRGDINLINQLIASGHDFNGGVGQRKMPPVIYYAVQKNFTEAVELLVSAGVNVNVKYTPELKSPLYLSAYIGNKSITEILCRSGANVNEVTLKGETPLFPAIEWTALSKNLSVIHTLLSFGADVNIASTNGSTPLIKAIESDSLPVIEVLLENGAKVDLIHYKEMKCALKLNNNQIIEYLLKHYHKESVDQNIRSNISAVDLCLQYFNLKAMRLSIELGFKASDQLFDNSLVLLKTILPNNHPNISDAMFCFDYLMTFSHLFDFKQTFAFKYELPNNTKIISGNLLTYALLFNCSYMSKRLIQIGVLIETSIFNYYRFDYNDWDSLKLIYLSGIQFPRNFCTKCYPNSANTDPNYKIVNKNDFKEFCLWIKNMSSQPYSLSQIVRIHLRNRFGTNLVRIVNCLKIPDLLVSFILFEK